MQGIYLIFGIYLLFISIWAARRLAKFKAALSHSSEHDATQPRKIEQNMQEIDARLKILARIEAKLANKLLIFLLIAGVISALQYAGVIALKTNFFAVILIMIFIICLIAPGVIISLIIESNIRKITSDIPMFIDLLAICVQSGMSIENSIIYLQSNIRELNRFFAPYLARVVAKMQVSGLADALSELETALPCKEIAMLSQTLKQSLRYGSGVYEQLMSLSQQIKEHSLLQTEEIIGSLSAKMSVPLILFFMFPVIVIIAAPGVMRIMNNF